MTDRPEPEAGPDADGADLTDPDVEAVLDWAEGRADAAATAAVEGALDRGDQRVAGLLAWFSGFRDVAAQARADQPPADLRPRLEAVFVRWAAQRARSGPLHLHARLVFDSRQDLALAGERSVDADEATVHLAYTSDDADVVLDVQRAGHRSVTVRGQVLRSSPGTAAGAVAEVNGPSGVRSAAPSDALGRFTLSDVPDDVDELRLVSGQSVLTGDLDLRGPR